MWQRLGELHAATMPPIVTLPEVLASAAQLAAAATPPGGWVAWVEDFGRTIGVTSGSGPAINLPEPATSTATETRVKGQRARSYENLVELRGALVKHRRQTGRSYHGRAEAANQIGLSDRHFGRLLKEYSTDWPTMKAEISTMMSASCPSCGASMGTTPSEDTWRDSGLNWTERRLIG